MRVQLNSLVDKSRVTPANGSARFIKAVALNLRQSCIRSTNFSEVNNYHQSLIVLYKRQPE